jgi:hypothetical protein
MILMSVAMIALCYLLQDSEIRLAFSPFYFTICLHHLQHLHQKILGIVASWRGHLTR